MMSLSHWVIQGKQKPWKLKVAWAPIETTRIFLKVSFRDWSIEDSIPSVKVREFLGDMTLVDTLAKITYTPTM
jgi:hypothetical protein